MLQQTQVARVVEKYKAFIAQFKTVEDLAAAPLKDVLVAWQGLGYNRRAKLLHEGAKVVVKEYGGKLPKNSLTRIPGIGPYTEAAIQAFAYNISNVCIETNIRTVYTYHFFKHAEKVHDKELLPLIEKTLDKENPREWYWALMDYGAHLKAQGVRINAKSSHYNKQPSFKGSDREMRGAVLRALAQGEPLRTVFPKEKERKNKQLEKLLREGLIVKRGRTYSLPS